MILILFLLLPLAALVAFLILGKAFWKTRRARWILGGGAAAAMGVGGLYTWAIFHSTSSTAAIGLLFVPFAMVMAAPCGAVLGWMAHEAYFHPSSTGGAASVVGLMSVMVLAGMTGWRIAEFRQMQSEEDWGELARVARVKLAKHDYFVLAAIASNAHSPESLLLEIATYPDAGLHEKRSGWIHSYDRDQLAVVRKVIRNPKAPVEALVKLAESKNEYVRGDVAQEKRTPVEVLRKLAAGEHGYLVDWGLAVNPSTPMEILERMPYQTDATIAQHLSRNTSTPTAMLEKLAGHKDAMVRGSVAGNASAPESVLRALTKDPEAWVARQAEWQLRQPR